MRSLRSVFGETYNGNWSKRIINKWEDGSIMRYEFRNKDGVVVDVSLNKPSQQGFPAANQVSVYGLRGYGGFLLNTPKNFSQIADAKRFAEECKSKIDKKQYGYKVPFKM